MKQQTRHPLHCKTHTQHFLTFSSSCRLDDAGSPTPTDDSTTSAASGSSRPTTSDDTIVATGIAVSLSTNPASSITDGAEGFGIFL